MSDTLNDNQYPEIHNNFPSKDGLVSLREAAKKYGYSSDHLRRLIRSGRVKAVRYGSKGNWYVDDVSLGNYHRITNQNRFPTAPIVLSEGSLNADPEVENRAGFARNELDSHYGTRVRRDLPADGSHRGMLKTALFALSLGGLLISGGLYYDILRVDTKELKTKSAN